MPPSQYHLPKKQLLQKLLSNLLGKQGRSFHELSNGVKQAIGTYKNFSKEWDELHGVAPQTGNGVQRVMSNVQQRKNDGSGGPGFTQPQQQSPAGQTPNVVPQQIENAPSSGNPPISGIPPIRINGQPPVSPIAGQGQTSSFNRPAPVSNLGIWGH